MAWTNQGEIYALQSARKIRVNPTRRTIRPWSDTYLERAQAQQDYLLQLV